MKQHITRSIGMTAALLAAATSGLAAQDTADRGAFLIRAGSDTIVIERFTRIGDTVQGSIGVKGQPREDYVATLGPRFTISALSLNLFREGATDAAAMQRIRVTMVGDSAIADVDGAVQRIKTVAAAVPLLNNSFALAEQFTRRARAAGGTVEVPAWALSGGTTLTITLRAVGADSMTLTVAGVEERLKVDAAGRILGGMIPSQHVDIIRVDAAVAATLRLGKVDYSAPAGAPYTATEVTLTGPGGITLGGTLTVPTGVAGKVPAVVTITGSGQEDRDEYIPVAGGYRPFRQVADTLGRRGIAVLRLDDRMIGLSGGKLGTSADYADDIRAALTFLRARPEIDGGRLALLGHSEGGLIAPMVAVSDPRLKGIVVMAGPAYNGLDIIHFQQRNAIEHDSTIRPASRDSAARVAAKSLDSLAHTSAWLGFFLHYDPLATARQVQVPVLILQGATDHQVTPEQADKLANAIRAGGNRDVTVHVFPALNHLFVPDASGEPSGYATLKIGRVSPDVLGMLADWLVVKLGVKR